MSGSAVFVFLMRHGAHTDGGLTESGRTDTQSVTRRFVEWLDGELRRRPPHRVVIVATGSPEAVQTARAVRNELLASLEKLRTQRPHQPPTIKVDWGGSLEDLNVATEVELRHVADPRVLGAYGPDAASVVEDHTTHLSKVPGSDKSVLLVGNDPFVGWLAGGLTGRTTALARGELLCLCRRPTSRRWRVLWNIAVEPPTLADDLRAKIKSKMDSAKALGAVVVALLTYLLTRGLNELPSPWTWAAMAALGFAAWLYFATLFLYDSLLMPPRFWGSRFRGPRWLRRFRRRWGSRAVQRPPGSTERLLHDAMTRVWTWVFLPATLLVGAGVVLLAAAAAEGGAAQPTPAQPTPGLLAPGLPTVLLTTAGLAVVAVLWVLWHRPRLGTSD